MLNAIRSSLKGVTKWIFVIVGTLAFTLVGVGQLPGLTGGNTPVRVGDLSVSQREFQDELNRQLRIMSNQAGEALTREEAMAAGLRQLTVEDIAVKLSIQNEADTLGLAMPRPLVKELLSRNEIFQNPLTGKFDEGVLQRILQQNNLTPSQFDRLIREDLLRQNLVNAASAGGPAPRSLADIYLARQTETRTVTWMSVTNEIAGKAIAPTEEDLRAFYDANPVRYTAPERRTLDVAFLRNRDFEANLEVDEEELRATFEANRTRLYEKPERRTLYQLTYQNEGDAEAAVARLRSGTTFEALALERGTTLEAVTLADTAREDILDQQVAEAAFNAPATPGTILDPVKGLFGATVVQLVDVTPAEQQSFEDVRDEIRSALLSQRTQRLVYDKLETIEEARDEGASLPEAASAAEIELKSFENIDRFSIGSGGEIVEGIPGPVLAQAFDFDIDEGTDAIEIGDESDPGSEGYAIAYIRDITPAALRPFDEVRDEVETAWIADERRTRIATKAREIADRLNDGETLADIGAELDRAPITENLPINGQHDTFSQPLQRSVFAAGIGEAVTGPARGSETQVIVQIDKVRFNRGSIISGQLDTYRNVIGLQLNQELLAAYAGTLRNEYGVEVNNRLLDKMFEADG